MEETNQQTEGLNQEVGSQDNTGLPSDEQPKLTVEEELAQAKEEAEKYKKMHQEAEKLLGKKGNEEGQRKKAEEEAAKQQELKEQQSSFLDESLRDFIDNGMEMTDELSSKLEELGLTPEGYKLRAYEYKDNLSKLYQTAGSKEAYSEIMNWAKDNVSLSKEELTIIGLKAMYSEANGSNKPAPRVEGSASNTASNRGYSSRLEISKDLAYLKSNPNDKGAFEAYRAKLARTPKEVIG